MTPDRRSFLLAGGAAVAGLLADSAPAAAGDQPPDVAKRLIADHEKKVRPLEIAASRAWWDANVSGKDEDFKRKEEAQNKLDAAVA